MTQHTHLRGRHDHDVDLRALGGDDAHPVWLVGQLQEAQYRRRVNKCKQKAVTSRHLPRVASNKVYLSYEQTRSTKHPRTCSGRYSCTPSVFSMDTVGTEPVHCSCSRLQLMASQLEMRSPNSTPVFVQPSMEMAFTLDGTCEKD